MRRKVLKYLRPYRFPFIIALGQVFVISMFEILKPWPFKVVIDSVLSGKPVPWAFLKPFPKETLLLISCVSLILIYLFLGGLTMLNNYSTIRIGQRMVNDLRSDLYGRILPGRRLLSSVPPAWGSRLL